MLGKIKKDKQKDTSRIDKSHWNQYLAEVKGLERDYMAEIVKSRRDWQKMAVLCFVFAVVAVLYHQFNPVTEKEPVVLRVNNANGQVDVVSRIKDQEKSYGEVVDNFFIADFVKSYGNYNYHSIQDDYDKVILMSNDSVGQQYKSIYDGSNGQKPRDEVLGKVGSRKVDIISVVPDVDKGIATVRFTATTDSSQQSKITENYTATLTYEYVSARIDEGVRLVNPLGFVVTSYREDKELGQ